MSKHTGTEGRLQHLSAPRMSLFYAFSHAAKSWLDLDFLVAGGIQYDHGLPSFCVGLPPNSASLPVRWSWNRRPVSRILLCGGSDKHSPVIGGIGGMAVCAIGPQDPPVQPPSSSSINEPVSGIRRRASRRRAGDLGWRSDREAKCSAATSWGTTLSEIPRAEKSKRSYCQSWKKTFKSIGQACWALVWASTAEYSLNMIPRQGLTLAVCPRNAVVQPSPWHRSEWRQPEEQVQTTWPEMTCNLFYWTSVKADSWD